MTVSIKRSYLSCCGIAGADPSDLNSDDPSLAEQQLTGKEYMIGGTAHDWGPSSRVQVISQQENFLHEATSEVGALGPAGAPIPDKLGGTSAIYVSWGVVTPEVERVGSDHDTSMSALPLHPNLTCGTDEQRENFLPRPASPLMVGCFGVIKPGADRDAMLTRASKMGCVCSISGTKNLITNSTVADVFIVWAKPDNHDGCIKGFIREKGMKGVIMPKIEGKFSLRVFNTGMIQMNKISVPNANRLPHVSRLSGQLR